jgi:hypothetical protein
MLAVDGSSESLTLVRFHYNIVVARGDCPRRRRRLIKVAQVNPDLAII